MSVATRWRAAHDIILSSPAFRADKDLQKIETVDMLDVWDDYSRILERDHDDESRRLRKEYIRRCRKAREGFKSLMAEMASGELTRSSRWRGTYRKIKSEPRFEALLGLPGSTPLDLWMDAVDDWAEEADRATEKIERALSREGKEIKADTTWAAFEEMVKDVSMDSQIDLKLRREAYDLVG